MAAGVLLGLALPPLAHLLSPLLVPALVIPLVLALMRLDWSAIGAYRRRPLLLLALIGWLLVVSPLLVHAVVLAWPWPPPDALHTALVLMAASSPIVASVAIALLLGLDATFAVVAVLVATALVPLTLPAIAIALLGVGVDVDVPALALRLALMIGGAFAAAGALRRWAPTLQAPARRATLDGLAVLTLVVFAIAIMDGVTAFMLARPAYAALAIALAFGSNLLLQAAGAVVFARQGRATALTAGLVSGNCNMGLVLVALGPGAPADVAVFFALGQLPMYLLPALLQPVYRRLLQGRD